MVNSVTLLIPYFHNSFVKYCSLMVTSPEDPLVIKYKKYTGFRDEQPSLR